MSTLLLLVACRSSAPDPLPEAPTVVTDADGDGFEAPVDCDDADATVNPDAAETWYDGIDSDCDGADDYDQDGDGAAAADFGGGDCDDTDGAVLPLPGWESIDACTCGNGVVEAGEVCEPTSVWDDTCDATCSGPCGDGVWEPDLLCLRSTLYEGFLFDLVDVNGDQRLDAIVQLDSTLAFLPGEADGSFGAPIEVWGSAGDIADVADVDQDGIADFVISTLETFVLLHDGSGGGSVIPLVDVPSRSQAGDFDGDGDVDILVYETTGTFETVETTAHLFTRDAGAFTETSTAVFPGSTLPEHTVDVDDDGRVDAVATVVGFSDSSPVRMWSDAGVLQVLDPALRVGLLIDVDGDGFDDNLRDWFVPGTGLVPGYRRGPELTSGPIVPLDLPANLSLAGGDVDGDGDLDLFAEAPPRLWIGTPSGFQQIDDVAPSTGPFTFTGDLDGDGRDEMVQPIDSSWFEVLNVDP